MPRDDDQMLNLPPEYGSGIIGVCDICGTRQAVIVLAKERYKLCVLDFLNKKWVTTDQKPGAPLPPYRSERVWYPSSIARSGTAQGILLTPTRRVRHPAVLVCPDVYGITTTVLDGAIRLAREGIEVFLPDVGKTDGVGPAHHLAMRSGVSVGGGVPTSARRVATLVDLYSDALAFLRGRDMVDPTRSALLGISYGGSLALALAARETRLSAVALAYPMPVRPADLATLVSAPLFCLVGERDRAAAKAVEQLRRALPPPASEIVTVPGVGHNFLSRDLRAYDLRAAEAGWARLGEFLKRALFPPPPKPPARAAAPTLTPTTASAAGVAPVAAH